MASLENTSGQDEFGKARAVAEDEAGDGSGTPQFENGFTGKVMLGALFVCLIMLPGAIYLGLVAGQSLGAAAQWVTIVLFSEVARRSFQPLRRQEIYCLFYMAGALTYTGFGGLPGISGGPFGNLIAIQYLMQSPAMAPIAHALSSVNHHWIAPPLGSHAYLARTFLDKDWVVPISVLVGGQILDRMKWIGLGYLLFRVTSDVERLPFPLAPVAASGATALAEANSKEESWRWRVFSTGTVIGLLFGFFYLAIPIFTGVAFGTPVQILPIPFFDLTPNTERALPTALTGYDPNLGLILVGFLLPFQIVLGSAISSVLAQIGLNPIFYRWGQAHPNAIGQNGFFPHYVPGSPTIQAKVSLDFDFWLSFGIGISVAIAIIGIVSVTRAMLQSRSREGAARRGSLSVTPPGRGDFPWQLALGVWLTATLGYVLLNHWLVPLFPIWIVALYGLVLTPLNSYVSARLIGLTGQYVDVPYLNQAFVLRSGYAQPDIWFAPLPLANYGPQAQLFRELELTGTKFTSVVRLELFMLPIILITSFLYWGFLWHTSDIPSAQFPYAQKLWPQFAVQRAIWTQVNAIGGASWARDVLKPHVIEMGAGFGVAFYGVCMVFKLPLLFFYGFMGGITNLPHSTIPTLIGALLGRFYFAKRFGMEKWQMYTPVLIAGFACGVGLIGMAAIALALISKTVNYLPF